MKYLLALLAVLPLGLIASPLTTLPKVSPSVETVLILGSVRDLSRFASGGNSKIQLKFMAYSDNQGLSNHLKLIAGIDKSVAVWVYSDADRVFIDELLRLAERNKFILFSNYSEHVKKGMLFSRQQGKIMFNCKTARKLKINISDCR